MMHGKQNIKLHTGNLHRKKKIVVPRQFSFRSGSSNNHFTRRIKWCTSGTSRATRELFNATK